MGPSRSGIVPGAVVGEYTSGSFPRQLPGTARTQLPLASAQMTRVGSCQGHRFSSLFDRRKNKREDAAHGATVTRAFLFELSIAASKMGVCRIPSST